MTLLDDLNSAGLIVRIDHEWDTNTNRGRDRLETVGIVNHWDAVLGEPDNSFYLKNNSYGGILYHIVIRRDGTLDLLSQRYVWHAGIGDKSVLESARAGGPIADDAAHANNIIGNPYFFSVVINYHPNEGAVPIPQYQALVTTNRVLIARFNLNSGQAFRHMDWTQRKPDIGTIDLAQFRIDIDNNDTTPVPVPPADWTTEVIMALPDLSLGAGYRDEGLEHLRPDVKTAQALLMARGFKDNKSVDPETAADGFFGPGSEHSTILFQRSVSLTDDGVIGEKTWRKLVLQ